MIYYVFIVNTKVVYIPSDNGMLNYAIKPVIRLSFENYVANYSLLDLWSL